MTKDSLHNWIAYAGLLLVTIIGLFPVVSLQHSMGNDILDAFLPARYFVSEAYRQGFIPLWDPYQFLGVPIYGDLVSVWNPEVWILSLFTMFNASVLQELYVFYVFLAGVGMYRLMTHLNDDKQAAFLAGVVYMFSGFFIGNAQNIAAISAATWTPFVILAYKKFAENDSWKQLFPLFFFLYLLIFNGYPGITIITAYFLLTYFVVEGIQRFRHHNKWLQWLRKHSVLALSIGGVSLVLWVSYEHVSSYIGQMGGVSLSYALMHPFSPQSSLSLLYPLSVLKDKAFFATDLTMTNAYVGIFTVLLFVLAIPKIKGRFLWTLIGFGFISLLASFGEYLPVRALLYHIFPLMNVSRYPAFFRLFFILSIVIVAFRYYIVLQEKTKLLQSIAGGFLLLSFSILFWNLSKENIHSIASLFFAQSYVKAIHQLNMSASLLLESLIQSLLLGGFLVSVFWKPQYLKHLFFGFVLIDMLIHVGITSPITVYNEVKPNDITEKLETMPVGYPFPEASHLINHTDKAGQFFPIWRNTATYHKWISPYGFGSFQMNQYMLATDSFPHLSAAIFDNPAVYFSTNIHPLSELSKTDRNFDHDIVFLTDSTVKKYDTLINPDSLATIRFEKFSPNKITLSVNSKTNQFLILQQNWFDRRQAFIDRDTAVIYRCNLLQSAIFIPKGNHHIRFEVKDNAVIWAFYFSLIVLFGMGLFYLFHFHAHWFKKPLNRKIAFAIFGFLFTIIYHNHYSHLEKYNGNLNHVKLFLNHFTKLHPNDSLTLYTSLTDTSHWQEKLHKYPVQIRSLSFFTSATNLAVDLKRTTSHFRFTGFYFNRNFNSDLLSVISRFFNNKPYVVNDKWWSFLLYDKTAKPKQNAYPYSCRNDMEIDYPFATPPHRDSIFVFNGHYSNKIEKDAPYSSAFHCHISDLPRQSVTISGSAFVHFSPNAKAHFVISINTSDSTYLWQAKDLFKTERNEWQLVSYKINLANSYPPDAELKLYIWNPKENPVWIDDFEMQVLKQ